MFCRKCGKEIPDDSVFCPKCGEKINQLINAEPVVNKINDETPAPAKKIVNPFEESGEQKNSFNTIVNPVELSEKSTGFSKVIIGFIAVFAIIFLCWVFHLDSKFEDSTPSPVKKELTPQDMEKIMQEKERNRKIKEAQEIERNQRALQNAIDFIGAKRNYSQMSLDELNTTRMIFRSNKTILKSDATLEPNQKEALLKKLTMLRKKEMPQMRKQYAKILSSVIWPENGSASVSGPGNTTINIVHPSFALNANIQKFADIQQSQFKLYGFKRATFWWYKGASEYSSTDYDSPADDDF